MADDAVRWRVTAFQVRQRVPARAGYRWDNSRRLSSTAVAQLTLAGHLRYQDPAGLEHVVGPGHLLLFAYREPTRYWLPSPRSEAYQCTWCAMEGAGLMEQVNDIRERFGSIHDVRRTGLPQSQHRLLDTTQRHDAIAHTEAVHRFVLEVYRSCAEAQFRGQTPAQRAVELIRRDPLRPWSLKQVADDHGCSREHLTRLFTETVGQSPGAYLANARLARAVELIRQSDLPLTAVAEQAGYAGVHTMARHVRAATGKSPGALRQA